MFASNPMKAGCLGASLLCALLGGCQTTVSQKGGLSPAKFQENMAKYAMLPGNKAIYLNTKLALWWVASNQSTPEAAANAAKAGCEEFAALHEEDPTRCVPVAVNDKQIYDPVPGAIQQEKNQATAQRIPGEFSAVRK